MRRDVTNNEIFKELTDKYNILQVIPVPKDSPLLDVVKDYAYGWDKVVILKNTENEDELQIQVIPLLYESGPGSESREELSEVASDRSDTVHELFRRWTGSGFNTHSIVDPFASNDFEKFIDKKLNYYHSEYMIFRV